MIRIGIILSGLLFIATAIGVYLADIANPMNWDLKWHAGKPRGQWIKLLYEGTPEERTDAVEAMVAFGPAVVNDLLQALRECDSPTRDLATSALTRIGEPALAPLRKACLDPRWSSHRQRFQSAIIKLGPQFAPTVAGWLDIPSVFDQRLALAVLCEWHIGPELILPRMEQLQSNDPIAEDVVRLLATIGKEAAMPLAKMAGHDRRDVRTAALVALGTLGPDAGNVLEKLQGQLESCDDHDRELIEKTIRLIHPDPV